MAIVEDIARIKDSYDKYIVRPINQFGLGGFLFDVEREVTHQLEADITDHYVEDNSAVQDHYALRPLRVTLKNYVGELLYEQNQDEFRETTEKVAQKLTTIGAYVSPVTDTVSQIIDIIEQESIDFEQSKEVISDIWNVTKDLNPFATRQQKAYLYFKALMEQNVLVSLETPFEYIDNMVIETLSAKQGEESRFISEFSITLKQIRFTETQFSLIDPKRISGVGDLQRQATENIGKVAGELKVLTTDDILGGFIQ